MDELKKTKLALEAMTFFRNGAMKAYSMRQDSWVPKELYDLEIKIEDAAIEEIFRTGKPFDLPTLIGKEVAGEMQRFDAALKGGV